MALEDLPLPSPGRGQVLVAVKAAGVNLFDTQLRSGLYKRDLPLTLGLEGAGIVEAVGADVDDIAVGDRVAFIFAAGSYATHTLAPAERVVPLPDKISFEEAAAVLFQGLTAHYLATSTFALGPESATDSAAAVPVRPAVSAPDPRPGRIRSRPVALRTLAA